MAYLGREAAKAALVTSDIPNDSITSAKIVDATIAAGDLAANSVDSSELVDGSVDLSHMSANSVDSNQYVDGSIDTIHVGDNQITLDKMAGGTDGNIISYDASGDPVAIATGDDGEVLTSTGAGSPPAFEAAGGVTGRNEGLVVKYVSATTVDIDADFLTVFDSSNAAALLSSINLTAAITSSGVNGLDTGSEAAVWYHIWVIYNGTTTASLLSASATSPTMPSGYTYKKYVGAVYNPSSSFRNFYQQGNFAQIAKIYGWNGDSTTSWVSHDVSTIIPTTAKTLMGNLIVDWRGTSGTNDDGNTEQVAIAGESTGLGEIYMQLLMFGVPAFTRINYVTGYTINIATTQTIYIKSTATGRTLQAYISSWEYEGIV